MVSAHTQAAFVLLVVLVGMQRLGELRKSRRHELAMLQAGGREHAPAQMRVMRVLHAAWLFSMVVEVFAWRRPFHLTIAILALVVFALGQALRLAAMRALGGRWTVTIMTLPKAPTIEHGIFRWLRHPNYLGVIFEMAALPLVHGAWLTSIFFTVANAALLRARMQAEETALTLEGDYAAFAVRRPRLLPRLRP